MFSQDKGHRSFILPSSRPPLIFRHDLNVNKWVREVRDFSKSLVFLFQVEADKNQWWLFRKSLLKFTEEIFDCHVSLQPEQPLPSWTGNSDFDLGYAIEAFFSKNRHILPDHLTPEFYQKLAALFKEGIVSNLK